MSVVRFGVSFEKEVLDALDEYVQENKFSNRSQALRQLVNRHIVEKKWQCNNRVAGAVTLVYDHHRRDIANHLGEIQLQYSRRDPVCTAFYAERTVQHGGDCPERNLCPAHRIGRKADFRKGNSAW